ncbi:MAG: hypothetical protein KAQ79_13965, partial [Cyclobacteriaceae bacterium]|nr:hypothetical protein [Cyclobacteriaceae bacterium]
MTYLSNSRRNFLKTLSTSTLVSATSLPVLATSFNENQVDPEPLSENQQESNIVQEKHPDLYDGPHSPLFNTITFNGNKSLSSLTGSNVSNEMTEASRSAPRGNGTAWGVPFKMAGKILHLKNEIVTIDVMPFSSKWLVFLHTSDRLPLAQNEDGFYDKPFKGIGHLNE